MNVEMENRLTTMFSSIDHKTKSFFQFFFPGYPGSGLEKAAKFLGIIAFRYIGHMFFRNHKNMTGCLGLMSRNASQSESWEIISAGISERTILQNRQESSPTFALIY